MPAYEYRCNSCNHEYIKVRSIKEDDPGYNCDSCGAKLDRVYSGFGVVFNGSGFYKTDNK